MQDPPKTLRSKSFRKIVQPKEACKNNYTPPQKIIIKLKLKKKSMQPGPQSQQFTAPTLTPPWNIQLGLDW